MYRVSIKISLKILILKTNLCFYRNQNQRQICSRTRDEVSKKIGLTANVVHTDHPPAWEFQGSLLKLVLILTLLIKMFDSKRRFRSMV